MSRTRAVIIGGVLLAVGFLIGVVLLPSIYSVRESAYYGEYPPTKAFYDTPSKIADRYRLWDDNYPAESYLSIYENSQGVVKIMAGDDDIGSGALVGEDLILTCAHCIKEPPDDMHVLFDYVQIRREGASEATSCPVVEVVWNGHKSKRPPGLSPLDLALIRIGPDSNGRSACASHPILRITTDQASAGERIYVIGHPTGKPKVVHDDACVLFPYELGGAAYQEIRALVSAERALDQEAGIVLKDFEENYVKDSDGVYHYLCQADDGEPRIGANCDTFHGDSGAPVCDRSGHEIIGILCAGQDDLDEPWTAGWARHERILPSTEVVKHLDSALPDWRKRFGAKVNES